MKIWAITEWYPHPRNSSHGIFAKRHMQALTQHFSDVELVLIFVYTQDDFRHFNIQLHHENNYQEILVQYPKKKNKILRFRAYQKAMKMAIKKAQQLIGTPDLIWCYEAWRPGIFSKKLSSKFSVPFVVSEHWTGYSPLSGEYESMNFIEQRTIKKIMRSASVVIPVSKSLAEDLYRLFKIKSIEVIGNVVTPIERDSLKYENFNFIHISTLSYQKNIPLLLESFQLHLQDYPDSRLLIIGGEGDAKDQYSKSVVKMGLDKFISFTDHLDPEEVSHYLVKSHALVMTSRYETFSIVLAEAWSAGIPVVSTEVGGLTDEITAKLGIGVSESNPKAVSQAMSLLRENYQKYNPGEISASVEQFYAPVIATKYHSLFQKLIYKKESS